MTTILRVPEDALVIVVGPAGSGKSTFVRRHFRPTEIVSSDRCRALVCDDEANQRATGPAFDVFDAIVRGRLRMGRLTVADATNLEPDPRLRLAGMARAEGRPVVVVVLDVPYKRAMAQNLARGRRVPPHVLELHYARFEAAREALPREGYDVIWEVRPTDVAKVVREPSAASSAPADEC